MAETTQHAAVFGATSDIAMALCHRLAQRRWRLVLAGRRREAIDAIAADLRTRYGVTVAVVTFDAEAPDTWTPAVQQCIAALDDVMDVAIACQGHLPDRDAAERDADESRRTIDVNFTSAVVMLDAAARHMAERGKGLIVGISSVAGDRGRQSNYHYGAAKAGFSVYLQGLRNRLTPRGVHVLTVKPGFVFTKMTRDLLNPRSPTVASPERIAADIDRAMRRRQCVLYTPWFWRWILTIICLIPESVFRRMKT